MTRIEDKLPRLYLDENKIRQDPNDYGMADDLFDLETFKKKFRIVIVNRKSNELEFDIIGVNPAIANAYRRLMLSEVPSMAIEKVLISDNTSVLPDEVLAHRLGLIPIQADARKFEFKSDPSSLKGNDNEQLEFELKIKCTRRKDEKFKDLNYDIAYKNSKVYSKHIKWIPIGKQELMFKESDVSAIENDILITKLVPGHELDIRMIAVKGIGKDHAKFSPVATAFYRILPEVKLNRQVIENDALLLQKCFSPGVIEIDENGAAHVKEARYDTGSRNFYRYPQLADAVTVSRVRDHFIFNVESVGAMTPQDIFVEAVKILKQKCRKFIEVIEAT